MPRLLLRPLFESCQTSLRERRRSSFNPVPHLCSDSLSCPEGSALVDDDYDKEVLPLSDITIPTISALECVQLPDHAPRITVPRHYHKPSEIDNNTVSLLPYSFSPVSACGNQERLLLSVSGKSEETNTEKIRWRLASGFFAYFLCGWGDGG